MNTSPAQQDRYHFLDGIRGIAAFMIVLHHAFTANIVAAFTKMHLYPVGFLLATITGSGVNLFFVLSGVVLLRPYLRGQRKLKVGDYFWRRLKRIYPPYFFALVFASLVIAVNTYYPTWYNILGMRVPFTWLETIKEAGIFSTNDTYYNLAWWSLQLEVAFYMMVPLIIFLFPKAEKITTRWTIISLVAAFASTLILQFAFTAYFPQYYNANVLVQNIWRFIDYPVCFLMGVLLAVRDFDRKTAWALIISGLVLILSSLYYFQLMQSGYGLVYGGVLILAFNSQKLRKILSSPGMIWLGERSYSLFLVHFSVFYLINNLVSRITPDRNFMYALLTRGIGIPVSIFVAMLLFHFVERRQARGLMTANMFWPWQAKKLAAKKPEPVLEAA